jgi:arylsulfatase
MTSVQNVVFLSIDALRADHLSCHGYHRDTTPHLGDLAAANLWFESAYSVSSHTREAIPGLLTGRYPDDAVDTDYRLAAEPIPSRVNDCVDTTAAFHSNPYVSRAFGYDRGFDAFDDDLHLGKHRLIALAQRALDKLRNRHYARADEINDRSLSWLDSLADDESFFLWNHYMDPHGPYIPPNEYRERYTDRRTSDRKKQRLYKRAIRDPDSITEAERQLLIDLYDAEIRYTDTHLGAFLDALDRRGVLDETAIIVTADHGDAFGEHGYYEHPRYLHEGLTHVPLVVRLPDSAFEHVETPASTLDISPTVLDLLDLDADLPGRSLRDIARERPDERVVFAQATGEDEDAHLRRFGAWSSTGRALGTYDTDTGTTRITDRSEEVIAERLHEHITDRADAGGRADHTAESDVDEEIERRLSALGYKE